VLENAFLSTLLNCLSAITNALKQHWVYIIISKA